MNRFIEQQLTPTAESTHCVLIAISRKVNTNQLQGKESY